MSGEAEGGGEGVVSGKAEGGGEGVVSGEAEGGGEGGCREWEGRGRRGG